MWKLYTQDIWGDDPLWRDNVTDEELADMQAFMKRHLRGSPSNYTAQAEGEGYICIRHALSGNPILELYRAERL